MILSLQVDVRETTTSSSVRIVSISSKERFKSISIRFIAFRSVKIIFMINHAKLTFLVKHSKNIINQKILFGFWAIWDKFAENVKLRLSDEDSPYK